MADIKLKHLNKTFDKGVVAVSGFDLEIQSGEFVVIVGPSGCGKSTVLRMIAGLEQPSAGDIFIGGERVNDVSPSGRDVAMVFQDYTLYPNLTVYDNLALGLKLRKFDKSETGSRVREAAESLGVSHLLDRKPASLSGGEKQRIALGRVLVRRPKVFLLDEPLSGIDAKFRAQMRAEIVDLHKKTGITFIYVTHDQTEAMTMGDRIVVMDSGRIVQTDTPAVLYDYPECAFTATFIGMPQMNMIPATLDGDTLSFGAYSEKLTQELFDVTDGKRKILLGVRPEHIKPGAGKYEGAITASEHTGSETVLYFNTPFKSNMIAVTHDEFTLTAGQAFSFDMDISKATVFDAATELSLSGLPHYNDFGEVGEAAGGLMQRYVGGEGEQLFVGVPPDAFLPGGEFTAKVIRVKEYPGVLLCTLEAGGKKLIAKLPYDEKVRPGGSISLSVDYTRAIICNDKGECLSAGHICGPYTNVDLTAQGGRGKQKGIICDMEFTDRAIVLLIKTGAKIFAAVTSDFTADIWVGKKIRYS